MSSCYYTMNNEIQELSRDVVGGMERMKELFEGTVQCTNTTSLQGTLLNSAVLKCQLGATGRILDEIAPPPARTATGKDKHTFE